MVLGVGLIYTELREKRFKNWPKKRVVVGDGFFTSCSEGRNLKFVALKERWSSVKGSFALHCEALDLEMWSEKRDDLK